MTNLLKYEMTDAGARERRRLLAAEHPDLDDDQLDALEHGRVVLANALQNGMRGVFDLEEQ